MNKMRAAMDFLRRHAIVGASGALMLAACCVTWCARGAAAETEGAATLPNIVFILADDLGYGDLGCYNRDSKIATAALDRLASEAMRFTDLHSPGAVCIPTRYGLLTGRYPHRADLRRRGPLLEEDRLTLPAMLRTAGYDTACIGKWHLGLAGAPPASVDAVLQGGPVDRGFRYFFGLHASLDIPPYYYIEGRHAVAPPTEMVEASRSEGWSPIQGAFWRAGRIAPGFRHDRVLRELIDRSVGYIERRAAKPDAPFFLYVALTAPHTPWLPRERYRGKSGAGMYGDFMMEVDAEVGRLLETLDRSGLGESTIVIFTSDNGPVWYPHDTQRFGHSSTGPLRGMKGDAWEGGHRMPMIVRWPGTVRPGSVCNDLISQTDWFATLAELAGQELPDRAAEDSISFLAQLRAVDGDTQHEQRRHFVLRSARGLYAVRDGHWKLIDGRGSGGFSPERGRPSDPPGQLYDLREDIGETRNLFAERPEVVARMGRVLRSGKNTDPP